jgi:2-polyprenyl-3-methyl-5-hydroxy-6-metoxy-1,4-benzoquinol methylase
MIVSMRDDADRWDGRYEGRTTGEPARPKGLDGVELPVGGRCLDVACGLGAQSIWAAEQGFDVVSLDASEVAITALNSAAVNRGVRDRIESRVVDLDDGLPADLAGTCALVICQRFRDAALYPQLAYMAEPGGLIVVTVLSRVGLPDLPGPFHAPAGELVLAFRELDVDIFSSVEAAGEATLVARRRGD